MGRILSDIFDWFLDSTSLAWPVKLILSLVVFVVLVALFGDYWDW
jgi:hypothetical protein